MSSQVKPLLKPTPLAPRRRSKVLRRGATLALWALPLLALAVAAPAHAARYTRGEEIVVTGRVTDADGQPLPGVEVVLTGHRRDFDVWSFKMSARGRSSLTATTDVKGSFEIRWRWDPFYNRFNLSAGIRQTIGGEETWWEVGASELTRAMKRGSPVVANLTIENADDVRSLQAFVAALESADAKRVYQELGKPDKVRKIQLPRHEEVTWWYFDRGMMYRFVDGRLDSSESFEPVGNGAPGV